MIEDNRARNIRKKHSQYSSFDEDECDSNDDNGFGGGDEDLGRQGGFERYIKVDANATPTKQPRYVTLAAPISRNDLND